MTWDIQLDRASFRNVEFDTVSIDDALERRLVEYVYPYRDGADVDDLGRQPRRTQLVAVFWGDEYESDLSAFMQVVDAGEAGQFRHPILGQWTARVTIPSIAHSHQDRDMAILQINVVEDGTSTKLPDVFSLEAAAADLEDWADEVDVQNAALATTITEATTAAEKARDLADRANEIANNVASEINQVRRYVDKAVDKARELSDLDNYRLVRALKRTAYSAKRLGDTVQSARPPLVQQDLRAGMPSALLAQKLFGDGSRRDEIETINRPRNPFLMPNGARLKVYAR